MARDRLAAIRAQQGTPSNDSYPTQASGAGAPARRYNPYAQQDNQPGYEMSEVPNGAGDDMSAFYAEISSIQDSLRTFNENVQQISNLHSRSLSNTDEAAAQKIASQLEELVAETSALGATLKRRIQSLESRGGSGRDGQVRRQQIALVKSKFKEAIQNYSTVEQQYRTKYKQRLERQFRIVKPDASAEEVKAVVSDESGGQIFSQALLNSNRYGESRQAYREVQERHEDIKRIEKTLSELAQLFSDMSVLVAEQDDTIVNIENQAVAVKDDTEAAQAFTGKAVDSARAARKKRWICFFLFLIILAIIGIVVGVVVAQNIHKNSNTTTTVTVTSTTASPASTSTAKSG